MIQAGVKVKGKRIKAKGKGLSSFQIAALVPGMESIVQSAMRHAQSSMLKADGLLIIGGKSNSGSNKTHPLSFFL